MNSTKIIRSVCYFSDDPSSEQVTKTLEVAQRLEEKGYLIQTKRFCSTLDKAAALAEVSAGAIELTSVGAVTLDQASANLTDFLQTENLSFNIELANEHIDLPHAEFLFRIISEKPSRTFNFTYTFNNAASSPYSLPLLILRTDSLSAYSRLI